MKKLLKRLIKRSFASQSGFRLLGPRLRAPGVSVLMYHRIGGQELGFHGLPVETFARQMQWLRERCEPISPEQLRAKAYSRRSPRPPVLVTFDDGYKDYYDLAYPVLKQYQIPAVVFLATSLMDAPSGLLWTEELEAAILASKRERLQLPWSDAPAVPLGDREQRLAFLQSIRRELKALADPERRARCREMLAALETPPVLARQMLNWEEVRLSMDLTFYGGHTHTHPILSRLPREEAEREIETCRERITRETGKAPTLFAYPNGGAADYTPETQELVRRSGFSLAFSTIEGIAGPSSNWLAIPRLPAAAANLADFAWLMSGLGHS